MVGYEADAVRSYFGDRYRDVPVTFAVQTAQRGTADAVRAAREELDEGPFVVLNGDALYDVPSLRRLYERGPSVGSYRVDNPSLYGVLVTESEDGDRTGDANADDVRVTGVIEKPAEPPSNRISTGAYHFPAEAQAWLDVDESERGELELTDVLERACDAFDVRAIGVERWLDVGRPWELIEATEWKLDECDGRIEGDVHDDAVLEGPVVVEAGARVRSGVVVEGPVLIREGATVGPNAYLRGATVIGENAKVGHAVEVKNSILMEDATVSHLSYVGDSVLGRDVNFGAGTTVANLRHDGAEVKLTVKGERVSTGRRKLGVVVGDRAKTGINVSLNAGVVLSTDARVPPGETVTRDR